MSPNFDDRTPNSSSESPCTQVHDLLSSFVDGRATSAEEQFVRTHLPECPECASELAFLRAMKTAWAKTPVEMPPASLSARIAAATYRKPTFAERFTAFFAFLQPAPMRVAIGVAAVAGIAYFAVPRFQVPDAPITVAHTPPAKGIEKNRDKIVEPIQPKVTTPVVTDKNEKQLAKETTPKPAVKKAPVAKPVAPAVGNREEAMVAQTPTPRQEAKPSTKSAVAKPTAPVVKQPTQVAVVKPKLPKTTPSVTEPPKETMTAPQEPQVAANTTPAAVSATTPTEPVASPQSKEPGAVRGAAATVVALAEEDNPGGMRLKNVNKPGKRQTSGNANIVVGGSQVLGIVSAPANL